jgi:copper chaperone NosL
MMTKASRIVVLVAALALGLVYVLPIWRIDLEAPQYPEGLGMLIRINTVEGQRLNDLNNINNLNHYIGMKRIEPDAIPELKVMPVVVGVLMLMGVAAAALGRRKWLYAWAGTFVLVSLVGLADFYKWEYDYGHNLDEENAIIKIPGMNYQPPLIGSKQLLNFKAHSWPASGGWILIVAATAGVVVSVLEWRRARRPGVGTPVGAAALAAGLVTLSAACGGPQPRPVEVGVDRCEHCLMNVADEKHAAEILTPTGRVYVFDSVECMAAHHDHAMEGEAVHSAWVTDFAGIPALTRADRAFYLVSDGLQSPMGLGLTAFAREADRDEALTSFGGRALDWDGVREFVSREWPGGRPTMRGMHGGHASGLEPAPVGAGR